MPEVAARLGAAGVTGVGKTCTLSRKTATTEWRMNNPEQLEDSPAPESRTGFAGRGFSPLH